MALMEPYQAGTEKFIQRRWIGPALAGVLPHVFARWISLAVFLTNGERKPSPIRMGEGRVRANSILRQRRHIASTEQIFPAPGLDFVRCLSESFGRGAGGRICLEQFTDISVPPAWQQALFKLFFRKPV